MHNLSTGLETLENNWRARETLAFAGAELEFLLPQLDDAANGLEESIVIQGKPVVVAQLERLRLLASGLQENVQSLSAEYAVLADVTQQMLDRGDGADAKSFAVSRMAIQVSGYVPYRAPSR